MNNLKAAKIFLAVKNHYSNSFQFNDEQLSYSLTASSRDIPNTLQQMKNRLNDIENKLNELQDTADTRAKIKKIDNLLEEQRDIEESIRESSFDLPSSFVGKVTYFEDLTMTIILNGKTYNYCSVPRRIFDGFKSASSKGAFFSRSIRGIFECG